MRTCSLLSVSLAICSCNGSRSNPHAYHNHT